MGTITPEHDGEHHPRFLRGLDASCPEPNGPSIGRGGLDPFPHRIAAGTGDDPPLLPDPAEARHRHAALAASLAIHAGIFGLFMLHRAPPPPADMGAMEISVFTVPGEAPQGQADGQPDPPVVAEDDEAPPEQKPEEVEEVRPDPDAPPDPEQKPEEPRPPTAEPSSQQGQVETPPSTTTGSGTPALGAKTHGDAQGLNPDLMASIGQAIATQVRACWTPPMGSLPDSALSTISVSFAQDGTIVGEPSVIHLVNEKEVPALAPAAWELEAVEAVKRCAPIKLPPNLYAYWRQVDIQILATPPVRETPR